MFWGLGGKGAKSKTGCTGRHGVDPPAAGALTDVCDCTGKGGITPTECTETGGIELFSTVHPHPPTLCALTDVCDCTGGGGIYPMSAGAACSGLAGTSWSTEA